MGVGKRQPNGKKIVELRQQKGLKQNALALEARISERLLRDIERKNKSVSSTCITAIANALGATPAEIILSTSEETLTPSASLLKLRVIRDATDLASLASNAWHYQWKLNVIPNVATGEDMRQLMNIVHRLARFPWRYDDTDEFDGVRFGEISRLARLQELLEKLRAAGVGVLTGSYVRECDHISKESHEYYIYSLDTRRFIICVHFVPIDRDEEVIILEPPPSLDDGPREDGETPS